MKGEKDMHRLTMSNIHQFFRTLPQKISWKSPKVLGSLLVITMVVGGFTYYLTTTTSAVAIMINGKELGLVSDVNTGKSLVKAILEEQGKPFGLIAKTHDEVSYKRTRVNPEVYLQSQLDPKNLETQLSSYFEGYQLVVDDSVVAVLPNKEDIDKVLKDFQDYYVKPTDENKVSSINVAEKITIEEAEVRPDQLQQPDEVLKQLIDGKPTTTEYAVQPNDSWWLIARKNNMLTDEVLAGNAGATKDTKLKPGEVIKLVNVTPYLTVMSQGTYTGTETIPFDVVTKTDNSLRSGQTKIIQQGVNGLKTVTYTYEQKNGIDIDKEKFEEKITQNPVTQIIAKGPNSKPVNVAYSISRGGSDSSSIVSRALSLQGTAYVFGGTSKSGFDCSGFTKYVYAGSGISLPRTSFDQFASGTPVSMDNLQPGDLVFFSTYAKGASHVGIYIGGGRFVHASNPSSGVKVSSLSESFYASRYLGARRY
jgi:cell wall-associated NlpC family hydrolase